MATNLDEIRKFLDEKTLRYHVDEACQAVRLGFGATSYRMEDGDATIPVLVRLDEGGNFIEIASPSLYHYKDGPNGFAVLGACLFVCYTTKLVQFEFDPNDGEIRATIELPLEDATLTSRQFHRCLRTLIRVVDRYHPMIKAAMETGKIVLPSAEPEAPAVSAQLAQLLELLGKADPAKLKSLLEQSGAAKPDGEEAPTKL